MKLKLKTLTPVHVSTGNDLEALDYIQSKGVIYRIHLDKALEIITAEHPDAPEKFADWIDSKIFGMERAGNHGYEPANKTQSLIRQGTDIKNFCESKLRDNTLIHKIIEGATLYKAEAPYGLVNNTRINEQIKDSSSLPIIPGSSLKGAIKTALAANAWGKYSPQEREDVLRKCKKTGRDRYGNPTVGYNDDALMTFLFSCRTTGRERFDAARFSIMRFFRFSDAHIPQKGNTVNLEVYPVNLYLRKKQPQSQTNPQEVIPAGTLLEFEFSVDVEGLSKALSESRKPEGMWRGLEDKIEKLFNVKIGAFSKEQLENALYQGLLEVIEDQTKKVLNNEKEWLRDLRYSMGENGLSKEVIQRLDEFYKEAFATTNGTLKTGWGSGFLSITIFSTLIKTDRKYLEEMFMNARIGVPRIKGKQFDAPNLEHFPKSKRLTAKSKMVPESMLGWIRIGTDLTADPRPQRPIVAETEATVAPEPEILSPEEQTAKLKEANEKLKLKDTINMAAVVTGGEAPFVLCRILHKDLETETFKAKYAAGLPVGAFVSLKVTFQKPGRVQNVTFAKTL
ncbi:MAG: hypothetical protein HBSAPP04_06280 [Ignavibacteriaceae bacterium]|nr:MAG: type III-A CRISPR-associated RAMP protein Csm5 [Chlorobiota bacterium]GJQ31789.1 MAG: hypothetical protein HBSAPP04_06280 [Ignavibacteriaceae bacterium]